MTLIAFLALAPLLAGGIGLVFWLWPDSPGDKVRDLPLRLVLGLLIGPGIGACIDYFWRLAGGLPGFLLLGIETLLAAAVVWAAIRRKPWKDWKFHLPTQIAWLDILAVTTWLALTGILLVTFVQRTFLQPHGTFDAYAIWNQRARFIYTLGPAWQQAFNPILDWKFHADYPLLLPLNVVRIWLLAGSATLRAPMMLALLYTGGLVCLLFSSLTATRGSTLGALAGSLLAATPSLLVIGTAQTADIPLAGYMLSTAVLLRLSLTRDSAQAARFSVLAGICAGLAAWTKNEGMLFCLVTVLVVTMAAWQKRSWRRLAAFLLGGAVPLAVVISFKFWLAPPGDLFTGQTLTDILAKLADGSRYVTILKEMGRMTITLGDWGFPMLLVLLCYALLTWKKPALLSAWGNSVLLLFLTTAGYAGIYLVTPHPLAWHLQYSVDRLLFQVYPLFLFILFQATTSPAEAGSALLNLLKKTS